MKKTTLLFFLLSLFCFHPGSAQTGTWTWISGDSAANAGGVYGTQGVPSINNHPPALYEYAEWKDKQGNFWLYGGFIPAFSDLWKYNPATNEWTWVKGKRFASQPPVFGTKGVPNINNSPGQRTYAAATWVDTTGNLWLFGGAQTNDLWKYDIGTNEWTWMHGDSTPTYRGVHGAKYVSSPLNYPGARSETCSAWTDSLNNLWLFGGYGYDDAGNAGCLNDMMKYDISKNEWTWMSGSTLRNAPSNYGTIGVSSPTNAPCGRQTYTKWKDKQGNFWLMGGSDNSLTYNDVWKYNPTINEWTCMAGGAGAGVYKNKCKYDSTSFPAVRMEHRSSTTDACGRFWMYGGTNMPNIGGYYNDLWVFDSEQLLWNWVSGSNILNQKGNYGSLGIPSVSNKPPSLFGASAWWGNDNRFYLFGGIQDVVNYRYGALWVFTPDSACVGSCASSIPPVANFTTTDTILCAYDCIDFNNLSSNAKSFKWIFAGAAPGTDTTSNPKNICYSSAGNYDVVLIAQNSAGTDTLTVKKYITVYPSPPAPTILQLSDTVLYFNTNPSYLSYQWYADTTLLIGATDTLIVISNSGNYNVLVTDKNGCKISVGINIILGKRNLIQDDVISISPNPATNQLTLNTSFLHNNDALKIIITNLLSQKVSDINFAQSQDGFVKIDVSLLSSGIYFILAGNESRQWFGKFVKE